MHAIMHENEFQKHDCFPKPHYECMLKDTREKTEAKIGLVSQNIILVKINCPLIFMSENHFQAFEKIGPNWIRGLFMDRDLIMDEQHL